MSPEHLEKFKEAVRDDLIDQQMGESDPEIRIVYERALGQLFVVMTFKEMVKWMVDQAWDLEHAIAFLLFTFCESFTADDVDALDHGWSM